MVESEQKQANSEKTFQEKRKIEGKGKRSLQIPVNWHLAIPKKVRGQTVIEVNNM
jgi:hypothetical protein